ncbi:MAG: CapA family protein [Christensenellaceae bacterium]|nr:CapA family protein [Christensenellaceae bacterium]
MNSFFSHKKHRVAALLLALVLCLCPLTALAAEESTEDDLHIIAVGDVMCLAGQLSAARVSGGYNFRPVFSQVKPIFDEADLVIGNLETVVHHAPYTAANQGGNPKLIAPEAFIDAAKFAGFDFFATANNHSMDRGVEGLLSTIEVLDRKGIPHAGTYASAEERANTPILSVDGTKIAILSYTQLINGGTPRITEDYLVNYNRFIADTIEEDKRTVEADIAAVKERGAELVLVYIHWGTENTTVLTSRQTETAQFLADAGADVILGSHPHVLQGSEYLTSADGRQVFVSYSLGNFVSSMPRATNLDNMLLHITVSRDAQGKAYVKAIDYMSTQTGNVSGNRWSVIPCELGQQNDAFSSQHRSMARSAERTKETVGTAIEPKARFAFMRGG